MNIKYTLLCALSLGSLLFAVSTAQAQLVFDNFDSGTTGDSLSGNSSQVGATTYNSGSAFNYQEFVTGDGIAAPTIGTNDARVSFVIPEVPTSGTIRMDVVINLNENIFSGIAGAWLGFTEAGYSGSVYNASTDHISLRLFTVGDDAGRLQLRTDGATQATSAASAVSMVQNRDYLLSLEYDLDTFTSTATVTDTVTSASTSASYTALSAFAVSNGHVDFTGMKDNDTLGELPYLKSISVVPEPSAYALLGGCLALAYVVVRRQK